MQMQMHPVLRITQDFYGIVFVCFYSLSSTQTIDFYKQAFFPGCQISIQRCVQRERVKRFFMELKKSQKSKKKVTKTCFVSFYGRNGDLQKFRPAKKRKLGQIEIAQLCLDEFLLRLSFSPTVLKKRS
jgi:hypothetical protein